MTILVVDDERNIRDGIVETIEWSDYGVDTVLASENGIAALGLVTRQKVDIVIADIVMPGMDGLELAERLNECCPETKVILLSGYSEFEYARRAISLGVEDYLLKPVRVAELISLVEKLCAGIREQRDRREASGGRTARGLEADGDVGHRPGEACSILVRRCKEYVEQKYQSAISLEDLARHVGKSLSYTSHVFKKETGTSFSEYLNEVRIRRAKELMDRSSMLIYEIAEGVGYSDYRYFTYVFKKCVGVIPSEYRRGSGR